MLSGYADENVKAAIVDGLRRLGMDVATAQERNPRQTVDELLLRAGAAEDRLLLTTDTALLRIRGDGMAAGQDHSGIVFRPQARPIGEAIRRIHQFALTTAPPDAANAVRFV